MWDIVDIGQGTSDQDVPLSGHREAGGKGVIKQMGRALVIRMFLSPGTGKGVTKQVGRALVIRMFLSPGTGRLGERGLINKWAGH